MEGLFLLSLGLFTKVVLADSMLSGSADAVFGSQAKLGPLDAWAGVLAFSGQIFFDFAGYSTCAIGAALCLGFVLPLNFRFPYAAIGFTDFWRRWHITLSAWLRDYLYIPLGGNRKGRFRTYMNLMATMLLGGLWHGANWTFVVWGGLHGLYLWGERLFTDRKATSPGLRDGSPIPAMAEPVKAGIGLSAANGWVYALLTFFLVNITWVFFRSPTFSGAGNMLQSMFGMVQGATPLLTTIAVIKVAVIVAAMLVAHWLMRNTSILDVIRRLPWWVTGLSWSLMLILLILSQESSSSFIYFQF
jgi:D-alanyl-lipoteichoic acid acyltransferase DltB (MBOAT superfamily)